MFCFKLVYAVMDLDCLFVVLELLKDRRRHVTLRPSFKVHRKYSETVTNTLGLCVYTQTLSLLTDTMADGETFYDEIEIEDMTFDAKLQIYHYPCPCGDRFEIGLADLRDGEDVGVCPSCSLMIKVIYDLVRIYCMTKGHDLC